jgi:hypothetical protein
LFQAEGDNSLVFCSVCGAPQITLSEELQELAAAQLLGDAEDTASTPPNYVESDPGAIEWKSVIALAAATAAGFALLSLVLQPLALLAWLAPSIVISITMNRHRQTRLTAGVGARIGALCGLFTGIGITLTSTAQTFAVVALHHQPDPKITAVFTQLQAQALAQPGAAGAQLAQMLTVPEFRAGFFLTSLGMMLTVLLLLSIAGGAFAGYLRSRERVLRAGR